MPRLCYDSIALANLPPGGTLYAGYDDGAWPDADAIAHAFPGATVIRVTVNPLDNEGDCLDVEKGDATPADAPMWVARRRIAGHIGPLVYCSESLWPQVVHEFSAQKVEGPDYWIAGYPGSVGAGNLYPGSVGHQYGQGGNGAYDVSIFVDYLPGIDPAPAAPVSYPIPGEPDMAGITVNGTTDASGHTEIVFMAPAGCTRVVSAQAIVADYYDPAQLHQWDEAHLALVARPTTRLGLNPGQLAIVVKGPPSVRSDFEVLCA